MNSQSVRPEYTVTSPMLRPAARSDAVSARPPTAVPNEDRGTAGCGPPRTSHPAPTPTPRATSSARHASAKKERRTNHCRRRLPGRTAGPEPFHEPHLEAEWRLDTRHDLEQRVGRKRELLHLGVAAWARLDVGERLRALPSCRDPESKLRDLLGIATAFGPGAHVVTAHRWLPSLVIVSRSFVSPARIRVFAVPSGIPSDSLISAAVIP